MTESLAVEFEKALDLLDDLTEGMLPLGGVSDVWYERISLWKMTARSLVNDHLKEGHMGNSTGEKVAAIRQAWEAAWPTDSPITHDSGPVVSLDLLATIAVNVLTDWHKRGPVTKENNMQCAQCSQPIAEGDLYVTAHRHRVFDGSVMSTLIGEHRVHVTCPVRYIVKPPYDHYVENAHDMPADLGPEDKGMWFRDSDGVKYVWDGTVYVQQEMVP